MTLLLLSRAPCFWFQYGMEGVRGVRMESGRLLRGIFTPPLYLCSPSAVSVSIHRVQPGSGEAALDLLFLSNKEKSMEIFVSCLQPQLFQVRDIKDCNRLAEKTQKKWIKTVNTNNCHLLSEIKRTGRLEHLLNHLVCVSCWKLMKWLWLLNLSKGVSNANNSS